MSGERVIIKALSLWEPWATLIRLGVKTFETRSWSTSYRGPLLICSSKHKTSFNDVDTLFLSQEFWDALKNLEIYQDVLSIDTMSDRQLKSLWKEILLNFMHTGNAVCLVKLHNCTSTNFLRIKSDDNRIVNFQKSVSKEYAFGDYSPNRYAWNLKERKIINPFPVTGKQGLFDIEIDRELLDIPVSEAAA